MRSALLCLALFVIAAAAAAAAAAVAPRPQAGHWRGLDLTPPAAADSTAHLHEYVYAPPTGSSALPPLAPSAPLTPVRAYLRGDQIPVPSIGAYGVVSLEAHPTSQSERSRLIMLCHSVQHYLPPQAALPASVGPAQQMLTIWPVDDPTAPELKTDSCDYAVDHYDLYAGGQAITDAGKQHRALTGRGPFLIGWSPSITRGVPDKLVLVVDMSAFDSQQSFDEALHFWKREVVENPPLWRTGFNLDLFRYAVADFLNRYGADLSSAVSLARPAQ